MRLARPTRRVREAAKADADAVQAKVAAGATRDPARLAPAVAFADEKGKMLLPAAGTVIRNFGSSDSYGGQEHGMSIATRPRSVVSSPADGWISFSGPYRSYGQLLITQWGRWLLYRSGGAQWDQCGTRVSSSSPGNLSEPWGMAPSKRPPRSRLARRSPILYVEFRKDGTAIDPSPWWVKAEMEKVRG